MNRKTPKRQPKLSTDSLLKTSKKKKDIELTEQELGKVSGGRKGNTPVEYIKLTIKDVIISG
jgi:hypothetical protein